MPRRKPPVIADSLLDQLLAGADVKTAFVAGGLLDQLKKALAERALNAEMDRHLANGEPCNNRNGYGRKTVTTGTGKIALEIPRDRAGSFDPALIAKYQRRFPDFDDKIVSMYARGMSVREIAGHVRELYGVDVSPDLISTVTDAVLEELAAWQARPLEAVYPLIFLDALRVKIRDGLGAIGVSRRNRPVGGFERTDAGGGTVRNKAARIAARRAAGRGDGTIWTELGHLRTALRWAEARRMIAHAPPIERPPKPAPLDRWLTREEIDRLMRCDAAPHVILACRLMLGTCARPTAALELTWNRVNLANRTVDLRLDAVGPRKGRAVVPIGAGLAEAEILDFGVSLVQRTGKETVNPSQPLDGYGGPGRTRTCNQTVMSGSL